MKQHKFAYLLSFVVSLLLFSSCGSQKMTSNRLLYDPAEVSNLSAKLGVRLSNLDKDDDENMPLYAESSLWLGVPYRGGGLSRKGVDCSGFAFLMYQKVYGKKIPRSTADLSRMKMKKVSKNDLQTGDFVFFATSSKNKINHVGIYLKDGYFVHASTSKGVIVSHLYEDYYRRTWKKGGRLK
ncbi:C40 family peptidase [Dysgonomonas sp. Marseille-P4361]|uniref:C40 family peptidase n=1 Tax=Dysgonomonas sp. Marseille-P4361 TaxID=2161820 RepID=UPI000D54C69D|nr:C40 family peptidase [Dysgonomonas sp. Marseille-P4361]